MLVWGLFRHRIQLPSLAKDHFQRPTLFEMLRKAIKPGAILHLEAPAGYGKSCELAAALAAATADQLRWLTLKEQDNDPARLVSLLRMALIGCQDEERTLPGRQVENLADSLELTLAKLGQEDMAAGLILVLDNVDRVFSQSATLLLTRLLDHMPDNLSLILLSRKALPFATHAYELSGRFTQVTEEALELTRAECSMFFKSALDRNLITQVAVEHLYNLTEGWLTPLALYRLEIEDSGEARSSIQDARNVIAFLQSTIGAQLTPAQLRSLTIMAEIDVISDELFLAIADGQCDLEFLPSSAAAMGLPIRSVPNRRRWYRMLPLVREWLLTTVVPGREARATLASDWFSRHGQFTEALRYALQCHDTDRAIRVASEGSEALLIGQDTASLLKLRQSLPQELIHRSPRLRVVYSWVHAVGGQFDEARTLLDGLSEADRLALSGRLAALRAFLLSGEGRINEALLKAEEALLCPELSPHGRLVALLVKSGVLCAQGRFSDARNANREASKLARQAGDPGAEILTVYAHARIEMGKGALKYAEQLLRTGLDTAVSEPNRPPRVGEGRLMLNLALVLWHQGRIAEAEKLLAKFIRHAEKGRDLVLLLALALRALACKSQGQVEDAFAWIGQAERTMHAWKVDDAVHVPVLEALKTSCWLVQGQQVSAAQAMAKLAPYREQQRVLELFPMMPGLLDTLKVRLAIACERYDEAKTLLDEQQRQSPCQAPYGHGLHIGLLDALVSFRQGSVSKALERLQQVIERASPEHYISPFVELREEIREMMVQHLAGTGKTPFTDALREVFGLGVATAATSVAVELPEPISEREFGVLELIAMGLSNQDIADKLHISLHTVKTHARRINAKLGVKSRTQAIVKARELGLL